MRLIHCACGDAPVIPGAQRFDLPQHPSQRDLKFLADIAREVLPNIIAPLLVERDGRVREVVVDGQTGRTSQGGNDNNTQRRRPN